MFTLPRGVQVDADSRSVSFPGERTSTRTVACQCPERIEDVLENRPWKVKWVSACFISEGPRSALIKAQWARVQTLRSRFTAVRLQHPRLDSLPEARREDFEKVLRKSWEPLEKAHARLFDLEFADVDERELRRLRDSREWEKWLQRELEVADQKQRKAESRQAPFWEGTGSRSENGQEPTQKEVIEALGTSRQGAKFIREILRKSEEAVEKSQPVKTKKPRESETAASLKKSVISHHH